MDYPAILRINFFMASSKPSATALNTLKSIGEMLLWWINFNKIYANGFYQDSRTSLEFIRHSSNAALKCYGLKFAPQSNTSTDTCRAATNKRLPNEENFSHFSSTVCPLPHQQRTTPGWLDGCCQRSGPRRITPMLSQTNSDLPTWTRLRQLICV